MRKNTKKAFSTIELLLVIGLVAGMIAGIFKVYKNIKKNNSEQTFVSDLAQVITGVNKYYDISETYPDYGKINSSSTTGWNGVGTYIPVAIGSKWKVDTKAKAGITSGITVSTSAYKDINNDFIVSTYNNKCEKSSVSSSSDNKCHLLVDKYTTKKNY